MNTVRVSGLTRLDSLELKRRFPDAAISFEAASTTTAHHGELGTIAVIVLTVAGVQALAAWLLKNRKKNLIERTIEVVSPDGGRRTEKIRLHVSESTSEADVVKEIARAIHVDPTQFVSK